MTTLAATIASLEARLRGAAGELGEIGMTRLGEVETCCECVAVEVESVARELNEMVRRAGDGETCPLCGHLVVDAVPGPDALTRFLVRLGDYVCERVIRDALAATREELAQDRVDHSSTAWTQAHGVASALRALSTGGAGLSEREGRCSAAH